MENKTPRLLRLPEVTRETGYGRASIYRLVKDDRFPKPVKIGPRAIAWREDQVDAWKRGRIAASAA